MKPTQTTFVLLLAAALLVGATGAVLATSGGPSAPVALVPAAATPTPAPSLPAGPKDRAMARDDVLTEVLDDLVAKGTITEAQQKAVLDGVTTERAARQAARKANREQAKADRKQLKDFLADGVITKEEFAKLPADSPLRTLTTLMEDGRITTDELKVLGRGFMGGKGQGHGGGWFGRDKTPDASPSPSAGTSG